MTFPKPPQPEPQPKPDPPGPIPAPLPAPEPPPTNPIPLSEPVRRRSVGFPTRVPRIGAWNGHGDFVERHAHPEKQPIR